MKRIALFIVAVMLGISTQAQGFDFGIKLGANFSNLSDATDSFDTKTGYVAGLFLGFKLGDNLMLQPELLYSQQGAEFDAGEFDLSYVNVPIIFKYYLVKGLNLQVGPQFGFVVDDGLIDSAGNAYEANSFDTSGVVGLGYDLPLGLRISARYSFGLTEVYDGGGKNSVITLAAGFAFL